MDIDLGSLLVLRHLAQSGSFTETGKRWNLSQPAVSLMISKLESAVGLVLLERSPTGTKLTPAGLAFLDRANEVCDAYLAFIDGMKNLLRRMDREVKVGVDRSWFSGELAAAVGSEVVEGIGVKYAEMADDWTRGLESTRYDVVLAGRFLRAGLSPGIQEAVIRRERGITVAWNPDFYFFNEGEFSFPEVLRTTVLLPDRGVVTGFADFLGRWCEEAYGMQAANRIEFPSEREAADAARAGFGVLLAPGDALPRLGEAGQGLVHVRTFEFLLPEAFTYGVYCRNDEDSREVLTVAAALGRAGKKRFSR